MGARGPMPGSTNAGRPSKRGATNLRQLPTILPQETQIVPQAPELLREAGQDLWQRLWSSVSWLSSQADRQLVEELCSLADELVEYRAALADHGALLIEPVVTTAAKSWASGRWPTPLRRWPGELAGRWSPSGTRSGSLLRAGRG